jgi:hypothetical protein
MAEDLLRRLERRRDEKAGQDVPARHSQARGQAITARGGNHFGRLGAAAQDWMTVFSPLSWSVVVLTIIVAFGVTLVSLGTDPRRLPMEWATEVVQGGERDGILDRVIVEYDATRPAGGYLSGRHRPPLKADAGIEPRR